MFRADQHTLFKTELVNKHNGADATDGVADGSEGKDLSVPSGTMGFTDFSELSFVL